MENCIIKQWCKIRTCPLKWCPMVPHKLVAAGASQTRTVPRSVHESRAVSLKAVGLWAHLKRSSRHEQFFTRSYGSIMVDKKCRTGLIVISNDLIMTDKIAIDHLWLSALWSSWRGWSEMSFAMLRFHVAGAPSCESQSEQSKWDLYGLPGKLIYWPLQVEIGRLVGRQFGGSCCPG